MALSFVYAAVEVPCAVGLDPSRIHMPSLKMHSRTVTCILSDPFERFNFTVRCSNAYNLGFVDLSVRKHVHVRQSVRNRLRHIVSI